MRCQQCQHENRQQARFCEACGSKLELVCAACSNPTRPGAVFCDHCGARLSAQPSAPKAQSSPKEATAQGSARKSRQRRPSDPGRRDSDARPIRYTPQHLAERILAEQAALESRAGPEGERKTITALFADVKGSMELIEGQDPEEVHQILDPALQLMMEAVHRYEGYVVQTHGDGIVALFGAPLAHEDHPQRALYAALRMQEEGKRYAARLRLEKGIPMQIRVGINTGEVIVRSIRRDDLHTDYVPVGYSTGLAARMESLATPDSILVTEQTYKLTEGYFQFKPLGAARVQGVSEPVPIFEVLGVGPLRTRLQVSARRGLARFVGRRGELEQMGRALELAKEGHGQIVAVVGEPGVGKSRLCYEFKLLSQRGCLVLEAFSISHNKATTYLPLIELLKSYFEIGLQDDDRRVREKVGGKLLMLHRSLVEDTMPYLLGLLGVSEPASRLEQMDPQIKRRRTLEAIKHLLMRESLKQPLLLIFEDLHWLDSESLAFLDVLNEGIATARILLLVNYRLEHEHAWGNKSYYTQLRLDPLGLAEADELLAALLGDGEELKRLKQLILRKTDGNPFFMEEIVQALFDQGVLGRQPVVALTRPLTEIEIPTTVQGVLAARIDRLPAEEKALLQTVAVIGREFFLTLLKKVVDRPEEHLFGLLSHLQEREFVYEQPSFPESEYTFKHALTQEVAYHSLLTERRRELHERTARAIEEVFGDRLEEQYGELAHHYSRSGNAEKAVEYLQRAGRQAVRRSAYTEAISHLEKGMELLQALPGTVERTQQELELQTNLGLASMVIKGYGVPEVEHAFTRARELCRQLGETPQLFPVLRGLWTFCLMRAKLSSAQELAEQLLNLARSVQDPTLLLLAHEAMGTTLFWLGELASAETHLEQAITLYDPQQHHSLASLSGGDPGVVCRSWAALARLALGYPDQALEKSRDALSLARALSHPHSLAQALCLAVILHIHPRQGRAIQERAEAVINLAGEQGFPQWLAQGTIMRGWALTEQGQVEEGIAQIHQGLAARSATGVEVGHPYNLILLAQAFGRKGQAEEGLRVLAKALATVQTSGERLCEAELYRLKGWLLLSGAGNLDEGEACFLQAIDTARRQSAKTWELRAVVSLSRLWRQQGKAAEARQRLVEVYSWFAEGFETPDLKEARALLDAMS